MMNEAEIAENLYDAGCKDDDIEAILNCCHIGDKNKADKLIAGCRKKQIEKLHESQRCIDRLDYLSYRLDREGVVS